MKLQMGGGVLSGTGWVWGRDRVGYGWVGQGLYGVAGHGWYRVGGGRGDGAGTGRVDRGGAGMG